MKRVLIFSLAYYPRNIGGAEVAIKEITDRISPEAIAFDMITLRFDPKDLDVETMGHVRVYRVGGGGYLSKILFPVRAALSAYRLHSKNNYDLVWAMMTYMTLPVVLAKYLGVRVPHVVTLQDGDPYEKVFGRLRVMPFVPIIDRGLRSAKVIQAISTYLAGWPARRGVHTNVLVVPNGASVQSVQEYPEHELNDLKTSLGKKDGDVFLVSVGRLEHQKAQDVCLRALSLLPPYVRYLMVGEGSERANLEALVKELGLEERVVFTGHVDRTMTAKYRKVSDIFVLPSRSEGMGNSFASTMVSGLPIVATQEGGLADLIFDAKRNPGKPTTAWAVDKDNPQQIADAVTEILAHPQEARAVTETAKQFAKDNFDWDTIAKTMQNKVFLPALAEGLDKVSV
ncbi:MAG TPA: glycosyltransferase family 4 protein [Candidatus Paceibacterota bacterium]|jgi:glycosyltransferase involved in cell wall biosynthesis|nr:glycosyltransferase family 4 protein [Candidatus Paceibacterota bacterium]